MAVTFIPLKISEPKPWPATIYLHRRKLLPATSWSKKSMGHYMTLYNDETKIAKTNEPRPKPVREIQYIFSSTQTPIIPNL